MKFHAASGWNPLINSDDIELGGTAFVPLKIMTVVLNLH